MVSSDPHPAGFEIRFGSLNFQATRNGYLMRITNRIELHLWRSTRPGLVPAMPAAHAPAVVWTSLGPLPWWVPGPTTRWAPRTTRLALHGT
jgi:hypothetical protein